MGKGKGGGSTTVNYPEPTPEERQLLANLGLNIESQTGLLNQLAPIFLANTETERNIALENLRLNREELEFGRNLRDEQLGLNREQFELFRIGQDRQFDIQDRQVDLQGRQADLAERGLNIGIEQLERDNLFRERQFEIFQSLLPTEELQNLQQEIALESGQRNLAALRGELNVPVQLRRGFEGARRSLEQQFSNQLGSGYQTSTAFNQALAGLTLQQEGAFDAARRDDLTQSAGLFSNAYGQSLSALSAASGGLGGGGGGVNLGGLGGIGNLGNPAQAGLAPSISQGIPSFFGALSSGIGGLPGGAQALQGYSAIGSQLGNLYGAHSAERNNQFQAQLANQQASISQQGQFGSLLGNIFGGAIGAFF